MITLTTGQLETWLGQVLWPFVRVGSCLMVAPVFSSQAVPARIRIVLAGAIALILAPMIAIPAQLSAFSIEGLVVTAQQVVIGIALGFCLQLVFDAITLGGQLIANSMGLSYALSLDPVRGTGSTALGELYSIFVTLVFLALNGHLRLIEVLADGFRTLPVGGTGFGTADLWQVVTWGGTLFSGALSIALPGHHRAADRESGFRHGQSRRAVAESHVGRVPRDPGVRPAGAGGERTAAAVRI